MQIKKIILVFKTHFDIGFTKLSREIMEYYSGEMLDKVAQTCDATREYPTYIRRPIAVHNSPSTSRASDAKHPMGLVIAETSWKAY